MYIKYFQCAKFPKFKTNVTKLYNKSRRIDIMVLNILYIRTLHIMLNKYIQNIYIIKFCEAKF